MRFFRHATPEGVTRYHCGPQLLVGRRKRRGHRRYSRIDGIYLFCARGQCRVIKGIMCPNREAPLRAADEVRMVLLNPQVVDGNVVIRVA